MATDVPQPRSNQRVFIRPAIPGDASSWESLRCELWPDGVADHGPEIAAFFAGTLPEPQAVMMAVLPSGEIIGFAELSIRTDLPGMEGRRTGYVEGMYLRPEFRNRGFTRRLLLESRSWAREQKCDAFASDRAGRIIVDPNF